MKSNQLDWPNPQPKTELQSHSQSRPPREAESQSPNEANQTDQQLSEIYAARWGDRSIFSDDQTKPRASKTAKRTPKNVIIELDWTMLAIWYSLYTARACITPGEKLSGVRAFRVFVKLIIRVATHSVLRSNHRAELSGSVVADESGRTSEKNSKAYPRKKKKRQTGEPTINDLSDEFMEESRCDAGLKTVSSVGCHHMSICHHMSYVCTRVNVLRPPAHVVLLESRNAVADGGFDFSQSFHGC